MMPRHTVLTILIALTLVALGNVSTAEAQETEQRAYRIGVGDRLRVSVWQEPTLDRDVEVGVDSLIVLPLVGPIRAGGFTPAELSRLLSEKYSLYKRDISQVEVVVVEYNSREIYLIGEVTSKGKFTFQEIPDLWEVIMEAGGPTQSAHLGEVRIMRGSAEEERIITVDLNSYLLGGDRSDLPRLQPGDTIYIPKASTTGVDAFATSVVRVYGEVQRPSLYMVDDDEDLVGALLLAGGISPEGDKTKVRIIREVGDRTVVNEVDVEGYFRTGELHSNPLLKAGDTIEVPPRRTRSWRVLWQEAIQPTIQTVTSTFTLYFLVDRIVDNNNNRN